MLSVLQRLLPFLKAKPLPAVIITGIGMASYQLAKQLQEQNVARVVAFIDDEPWSNLTKMLAVTVHYPSDMVTLSRRYNVKLIVKVQDESESKEVFQAVDDSGFPSMIYRSEMDLKEIEIYLTQ